MYAFLMIKLCTIEFMDQTYIIMLWRETNNRKVMYTLR
jgi:hypothetical protein